MSTGFWFAFLLGVLSASIAWGGGCLMVWYAHKYPRERNW